MAALCPTCGRPLASSLGICSFCLANSPPLISDIPPDGARVPAVEVPFASHGFSCNGRGGTLFGIYVVNVLLMLVTLGVYYFWGKAKIRRYVYSETEVAGDRFAFHGTGWELLKGFAKAMVLIVTAVAVFALAQWAAGPRAAEAVRGLLSIIFGIFVVPVAIVGARRYRSSRTSWRGIRFTFRGHARELMMQMFRDGLFTGLTFGIYYPYFQNNLREFIVTNSGYGSVSFEYDGDGGELWRIYFFGLLFGILTLGVYYFWFSAARQRFYWSHTSFAGGRFVSKVTGGGLFRLMLGNAVLFVLTLGLAWPWIKVRNLRYVASMLSLEDNLDLTGITQQIQAASATGEGLADMLDVGFLDVDLGV